jgi:phage-related protein
MKPTHFLGSSLNKLRSFPEAVRSEAGFAIYMAQQGGRSMTAAPLAGFGGKGVLEVVIDHRGDTYHAVYTVKFRRAVYVLYAFKRKQKRAQKHQNTKSTSLTRD